MEPSLLEPRRRLRQALAALRRTVDWVPEIDPALRRRTSGLAWEHSAGARRLLAVLVVLKLVVVAATLAVPGLVGQAVDAAVTGRSSPALSQLATVAVVLLAGSIATPICSERFSNVVLRSLRARVFTHALDLGIPGRRSLGHGDLLARFAGDTSGVARYFGVWADGVATAAFAVGGIVALVAVDWIFAVVLSVAVLFVVAAVLPLLRRFSDAYTQYRSALGELVGRYVGAHQGRRTIRACGTLRREVERILVPLGALCAAGRRQADVNARGIGLLSGAERGTRVAMLATGALLLAAGRVQPGELVAAFGYAVLAYANALQLIGGGLFTFAQVGVNGGRVAEVVDRPPATPRAVRPARLPAGPGSIVLSGVRVDADAGPILQDVDLQVPGGATLAVVGRSGAGKSTIAALVGRLLDPDAGTVAIDGVDVRDLDPEELASVVAFAFERPRPLGSTVAGTIAYGTDADERQVRAAAAVAAAEDFIERLPDGYATALADAPLSGGERQRLGLARAAIRQARVLVLDDAMSSLDTATEARVAGSLAELARGRTTLVVAHRASTAARAELVAWLDAGRIRRVGPHRRLWDDPAYRAAFDTVGTSE